MANKTFDFLKNRKLVFIIASAIVAIAILVTAIFGLNIDIEFKGGSIATYSYEGSIDLDDIAASVKKATGFNAKLRISENNVTDKDNVIVSIAEELSSEQQSKMTETLEKEFKDNKISLVESSSVNPMNGNSFFVKCLLAVLLAAALIVLYVAVRFRNIGGWSAGVTAVIALVFDLIVTYSVYAIFRIEIGGNFMAVMLTILGYSINNTIVVFDRIRENKENYGKKLSVVDNVNMSLNQSLQRAINTTLTTLMALAVVIVVCMIYGINSMFDFLFPMAVGLISGVFSSLLISPALWVTWQESLAKKPRKRR